MHLSKIRHIVLSKIYALRVMSYNQIYEFVFKENNQKQSTCEEIVKKMVAEGLLEKIGTPKTTAKYFIAKAGIKALKEHGIIPIGKTEAMFPEHFHTASKIKIKEVYCNHQLALNQFVLEFERIYKGRDMEYLDELYMASAFTNIRPDGLLRLDNTYYFLEMDMNTERKQRLNSKWENYRQFVLSREYDEISQNIKVLFILGGNVGSRSARVYNLRSYIMQNISHLLSKKFDVIVNTKNNLFSYIHKQDTESSQVKEYFENAGYMVSQKNFTDASLLGYTFDHYALVSENNAVKMQDGIALEFLIDDFSVGSMYVMQKINMHYQYNDKFLHDKKRDIKYIVVVDSMYDALKIEQILEMTNENIYYTTIERLKRVPFHEALFKISNGESYHFTKDSLKVPIYEGKITNELKTKRGF